MPRYKQIEHDVIPLTPEEEAEYDALEAAFPAEHRKIIADIIRRDRDCRLQKTDWTQAPDVPQATKDKWAAYRQQLRDLPQAEGFPWYDEVVTNYDAVPWPTKPE